MSDADVTHWISLLRDGRATLSHAEYRLVADQMERLQHEKSVAEKEREIARKARYGGADEIERLRSALGKIHSLATRSDFPAEKWGRAFAIADHALVPRRLETATPISQADQP